MKYEVIACRTCGASELQAEPVLYPPRVYLYCCKCSAYVVSLAVSLVEARRVLVPGVSPESNRSIIVKEC